MKQAILKRLKWYTIIFTSICLLLAVLLGIAVALSTHPWITIIAGAVILAVIITESELR